MNALVREHGGSSERWVESSCGETRAGGADAGIVGSAIGPGDRTDDRRGAAQERRPPWARLANPRVGSGRAECLRELLPGVPPRKGLREVQHDASHRALGPYGALQQALAQRPGLRPTYGPAPGEALPDLGPHGG